MIGKLKHCVGSALAAAAACALLSGTAGAAEDTYPARPVRLPWD